VALGVAQNVFLPLFNFLAQSLCSQLASPAKQTAQGRDAEAFPGYLHTDVGDSIHSSVGAALCCFSLPLSSLLST
jgi:hypothetical protein